MALPGHAFELQFGAPNPPITCWVLPDSAQFQYQIVASLWGRSNEGILYLKVAKILCKFELEGHVYGGDERRKMRIKEERRERGHRVLRGHDAKGGTKKGLAKLQE